MALKNPWFGFVTRTYEQAKEDVLLRFQSNVPEITDHTESNPWVKGISVWAGILEQLSYYLDNKGREAFLSTARKFESGVKIAKIHGYRIKGVIAASVDLTFTTNINATSQILIPIGTTVRTKNNVSFRTIENAIIEIGSNTVQVKAKQWTPVVNEILGNSDGSKDQVFELTANVVDNAITVLVGADNFTPVSTFSFSTPTDKHFVAGLNENNNMEITFGDGMAGIIPQSSSEIKASYYTSQGKLGNVTRNTINIIVDTITLPTNTTISVNNINAAVGGVNSEDLVSLRKNIPLSQRTKLRAVTDQDFIDLAQLVSGVAKSGINYDCGNFVDIYIAPVGGGVASNELLSEVKAFFSDKRITTVQVNPVAAGEILVKIQADIKALPNYSNSVVLQSVQNNLIDFLSVENQDIKGTVYLSDIYEVIENTAGVSNSDITLMSPVPFARQIGDTTTILNWTRNLTNKSVTTIKWGIRFVDTNKFELTKNDLFVNTYMNDINVIQNEITFQVNGSYNVNDQYEFYTYAYNDRKIVLTEASIPVTDLSVLFLNVTGGIE